MRYSIKRIVSVCLALLIGLMCLSISAGAADTPTIAAGKAAGKPGERVSVDVTVADNPGFIAVRVFVKAEHKVLRLVGVENGELFSSGNSTFGKDLDADEYAMLWIDSTTRTNMTQDGVLAKLTFEIVGSESDAGTYPITLRYDMAFDVDLKPVTFTPQNGSIEVRTETTYSAVFMADGAEYSRAQYKAGDAIVKPADPVKEGYTFTGWSPEVPALMPAQDMTFTAQFKKNETPPAGKVRSVKADDLTVLYNRSGTLKPVVTADSGVKYTIAYSGYDSAIISVDAAGNVTVQHKGRGATDVTITVTDEYGNTAKCTCTVTVQYAWWQLLIMVFLLGFIWY